MSNDFSKSKAAMVKLVEKIKLAVEIEETKKQGLTKKETIDKLIGDIGDNNRHVLGKLIKVLSAFNVFYKQMKNTDVLTWKALDGYAYIVHGYIEHPKALDFVKNLNRDLVLKDILDLILESEEMSLEDYFKLASVEDKELFLKYISKQPVINFYTVNDKGEEFNIQNAVKEQNKTINKSVGEAETSIYDIRKNGLGLN